MPPSRPGAEVVAAGACRARNLHPDRLDMTETSPVGVPAYGSYLPTTHNVPAFLLPRLAEMATEVPNTNTGRGIYYERDRPGVARNENSGRDSGQPAYRLRRAFRAA
jgi:hypothetical protein